MTAPSEGGRDGPVAGQIRSDSEKEAEEEPEEEMEQEVLFSGGSVSDMTALQGMVGTREGEAEPPVPILNLAASLIHSYRKGNTFPGARTLTCLFRITSLVSIERLDGLLDQAREGQVLSDYEASARRFVSAVITWVYMKDLDLLEGVELEIQERQNEWLAVG